MKLSSHWLELQPQEKSLLLAAARAALQWQLINHYLDFTTAVIKGQKLELIDVMIYCASLNVK